MHQTSLLAHLYPYFKGSQEDVATSSLNYIVSSNPVINQSFVKHIGEVLDITINEGFQFKCQASGENGERPDMAGYDANGNERILWESKFYAALTINQPNEYLNRLNKNSGLGLVFVCPEIRQKGLWAEIKEVLSSDFSTKEINDHCIEIDGHVRLGITTWKRLLNQLEEIAVVEAPQSLSDIKQLQGYCQQMDSDAFIPFKEDDFGIDNAVKEERHYRLVDSLVEALKNTPGHTVSLKRLRATPVWAGYRRYFILDGYAVTLEYDTKKWKDPNGIVTPYWICIKNEQWKVDDACQKAMMKIDSFNKKDGFIALIPRCYVALSEIVEDMKKQVFAYIDIFNETK